MRLQHYERFFEVQSSEELRAVIATAHPAGSRYSAFWLHCDDEPALSLLLHGDRATLCYEPGLRWSRNPDPDVDPMATVEFQLENGQIDAMPLDTVVSVDAGIAAFAHFLETEELGGPVAWHSPK